MKYVRALTVCCATFLLYGCSGSAPQSASTVDEPIINGTPLPGSSIGTIQIFPPNSSCSAVLLAGGTWALTAKHCVNGLDPSSVGLGPRAVPFVVNIFAHPTLDVALLELTTQLFHGDTVPLAMTRANTGETLYCEGWGLTAVNGGPISLSSAYLPVQESTPSLLQLVPNSAGQIDYHGDSGSGCFRKANGTYQLAGIFITFTPSLNGGPPTANQLVPVTAFRDWVEGLVGNSNVIFSGANETGLSQTLTAGGPTGGSYTSLDIGDGQASSWTAAQFSTISLVNSQGLPIASLSGSAAQNLSSGIGSSARGATVNQNGVVFWPGAQETGTPQTFSSGGTFGTFGTIGSMFVPAGWRVRISNSAQTTNQLTLEEGTHWTIPDPFFNSAGTFATLQFIEPALVMTDPAFNAHLNGAVGNTQALAPGCYDTPPLAFAANTISSVFVPWNDEVILFDGPEFNGNNTILTSSTGQLGAWDNRAQSLCVLEQSSVCGILQPGQALMQGQSIESCDGRFSLILQTDGNLVLYENPPSVGSVLWTTGTSGNGGTALVMQNDGNLVFYDANWHPMFPNCFFGAAEGPTGFTAGCVPTNTSGQPNAVFTLGTDGNLAVISTADQILWQSFTAGH